MRDLIGSKSRMTLYREFVKFFSDFFVIRPKTIWKIVKRVVFIMDLFARSYHHWWTVASLCCVCLIKIISRKCIILCDMLLLNEVLLCQTFIRYYIMSCFHGGYLWHFRWLRERRCYIMTMLSQLIRWYVLSIYGVSFDSFACHHYYF